MMAECPPAATSRPDHFGGDDEGEAGDESRSALPGRPPIPTAASLTTRNGHREPLEPATGRCQRWSPAATNVGIHVAAGLQVAVRTSRCRPLTCNSLVLSWLVASEVGDPTSDSVHLRFGKARTQSLQTSLCEL